MLKIYLAGGMRSGWQSKILTGKIKSIDDKLPDVPLVSMFDFVDPRSNGGGNPDAFTTFDLFHLNQSDIVFVYFEKDNPSGFGLAAEMGFAKANGSLIIFVNEQHDNKYTKFLEEISNVVFTELNEGINYLINLLIPGTVEVKENEHS